MSERKYNNGEWTEARFNSFIKSGLRSASQRWPPRFKALHDAFTGSKINQRTGRIAKHYRCRSCEISFPLKEVQVNHIHPVVPTSGFVSWDDTVERLFCEQEGLEVLCKPCHKEITKQENAERKEQRTK